MDPSEIIKQYKNGSGKLYIRLKGKFIPKKYKYLSLIIIINFIMN